MWKRIFKQKYLCKENLVMNGVCCYDLGRHPHLGLGTIEIKIHMYIQLSVCLCVGAQ